MQNRKLVKKIIKILILLLSLLLTIRLISITMARYESRALSNPNIQVAFYIIKKDYQKMNLNLGKIYPSNTPFVYTFSISNNDGNKACETDMEYDLKIRTTTNLPIEYELYMNENFNTPGATNKILNNEVITDKDGTYFRIITTNTENFTYIKNQTNVYQLVVKFPEKYNNITYQDTIEAIEISVNSRQVI